MSVLDEVLKANAQYAADFGAKGELGLPPARGFAILTCMDARLDPAKYAGLSEGDAHVIRNAGGRASDDAIRSLVISYKLLGTSEWFVIHHTDCGMEFFTERGDGRPARAEPRDRRARAGRLLRRRRRPGSPTGKEIDWLTIGDREQSVVDDVAQDPRPPARPGAHPDLRLRLRRPHRPSRRGPGRHRSRPRLVAEPARGGMCSSRAYRP